MNQGWIKLPRTIKESPVWHEPHYLRLWLYCQIKASHKDREVFYGLDSVQIKKGQFVTGRIKLADEMNEGMKKSPSASTWWRDLQKLEKLGMIEIHSTTKHSIVTICNWEQYQEDEAQQEQPKVVEVPQEEKQVEVPDFPEELADEKDYGPVTDKLMDARSPEVTNFYRANGFGSVGEHIEEKIEAWCNDLSHELVLEAMKIAVENGANNWGYTEAILRNWANKKFTTLDQVKADQLKRKAEREHKQSRNYGNRPIRQEKLPDWYGKQKKDEPEQVDEEKRQRLLAIQAKYKKEMGT